MSVKEIQLRAEQQNQVFMNLNLAIPSSQKSSAKLKNQNSPQTEIRNQQNKDIFNFVDQLGEKDLQELKQSLREGMNFSDIPLPGKIQLNRDKGKSKGLVSPSIKLTQNYVTRLFIEKFPKMDIEHQGKLLLALDDIDNGKKHLKEVLRIEHQNDLIKYEVEPTQANEPSKQKRHKLKLIILTTHGSRAECGLTEIDIFDRQNKRLTNIQSVKVNGSPLPNQEQAMCLCDGYTYTTDPNHMWFCNLPLKSEDFINIELTFFATERIGGIRIWNYNKSVIDSRMGVKQTKIYLDGSIIYQGSLKQAPGVQLSDYSHFIPVQYLDEESTPLIKPMIEDALKIVQGNFRPENKVVGGSFNKVESESKIERMSLNLPLGAQNKNGSIEDMNNAQKIKLSQGQSKKQLRTHPKVLNIFSEKVENNYRNSSQQQRDQQIENKITTKFLQKKETDSPILKRVQNSRIQSESSLLDEKDKKKELERSSMQQIKPSPQQSITFTPPIKLSEVSARRLPNNFAPRPFSIEKRRNSYHSKVGIVSIASKLDSGKMKIPELPEGRILKISILSNQGDMKYVGLGGIEIFDDQGDNISKSCKIQRVYGLEGEIQVQQFQNLVQSINLNGGTLIKNQKFDIEIDLEQTRRISLIRIWNYSKSRIYIDRGVKKILLSLEDKYVNNYQQNQKIGIIEVRKATANHSLLLENQETILFTSNKEILERIALNDWLYQSVLAGKHEMEIFGESLKNFKGDRPRDLQIYIEGKVYPVAILFQKEDEVELNDEAKVNKQNNLKQGSQSISQLYENSYRKEQSYKNSIK